MSSPRRTLFLEEMGEIRMALTTSIVDLAEVISDCKDAEELNVLQKRMLLVRSARTVITTQYAERLKGPSGNKGRPRNGPTITNLVGNFNKTDTEVEDGH